jgi:exodeoxyribonuclease VII large subunit
MNEKLSLTELQLIIKDSLYLALPDMYWVVAEISEIRENFAGHCYLELIEKLPDDQNIRARARGIIWSNRYRFLKPLFESSTGESLRVGIKILIRVRIEYHEVYGLSLIINDIDPSYTLGEMAMKRLAILRKLEEDGVLNMNKELDFPVVPQRIAVVSSKNAAGYTDFVKQLTGNSFGYVFYTALIDTPMQGNETEKGVLGALNRIAGMTENFDVVVIIRGGGSQTDLSWFDNYNIAYYVTQFPLPVITGIGHEKDLTVTDIVAYRAMKTPTAVADFLVECMNNAENHILDMSTGIIKKTQALLETNRLRIENSKAKLIPVARIMISELKEELSGTIIEMINIGKDYIIKAGLIPSNQKSRLNSGSRSMLMHKNTEIRQKEQNLAKFSAGLLNKTSLKISGLENSLNMLNPLNVLRRGYTITSRNGKIIRQSSMLGKDDIIDTVFSDGKVKSKVLGGTGEVNDPEKLN